MFCMNLMTDHDACKSPFIDFLNVLHRSIAAERGADRTRLICVVSSSVILRNDYLIESTCSSGTMS